MTEPEAKSGVEANHPSPDRVPPAVALSRIAASFPESSSPPDGLVDQQMRQMTRRSFVTGAVAALAGFGAWRWVNSRPREGRLPWPLRRVLELNEKLSEAYASSARLAPEFPAVQAGEPKINGKWGLGDGFVPAQWKLRIRGPAGVVPRNPLTLAEIQSLPRIEIVTELKCVEGWSQVVRWAGVRFVDFVAANRLATRSGQPPDPVDRPADLLPYVGLSTPDQGYYVGLDMRSALHPQTMLCYEMNGQPLTLMHGGPLRLVTAVHYGYKSIKRVGTIDFTEKRPRDLWAEKGFDWYAGH